MEQHYNLTRFLDAQNQVYLRALEEIEKGRKTTHRMWFIFPQLAGLGRSDTAKFYAIEDIKEATNYLHHPVLGRNLISIASALLVHEGKSANDTFGSPDDMKLRSSMTLFSQVDGADPVFREVLLKYFAGSLDPLTMNLLQNG